MSESDRHAGNACRTVRFVFCLALVGGVGATACSDGDDGDEVELPVENGAGEVSLGGGYFPVEHPRPDSIVSLVSDGSGFEPSVLRLFRSPHRFPVGFSTYLPTGVEVVETSSDRILFGHGEDTAPDHARFEIIVLAAHTSSEEARGAARASISGPGQEPHEYTSEQGVVASWVVAGDRRTERAELVRDGDRWVVLRASLPTLQSAYEARFRAMRKAWIWDATGDALLGP